MGEREEGIGETTKEEEKKDLSSPLSATCLASNLLSARNLSALFVAIFRPSPRHGDACREPTVLAGEKEIPEWMG